MASSHSRIAELRKSLDGRLRATVICLSHSWGGLEQVAAQDSLDVGALGLDVRALVYEDSPIHKRLAARREVKTIPIRFEPRNTLDLKLRAEIHKLTDGEDSAGGKPSGSAPVNLVHCHQTSVLGSVVPWLWRRPRVSAFATRHILNNHDKRSPWHRAVYGRLDALIVMSQALKRNVLETHAIRERKIRVVNLGLDYDYFDPDKVDARRRRAEWGADDDTCVIGLVGRIDPAKGQATFIKAAAGLLKGQRRPDYPNEKLRFVIVGEETRGSDAARAHLEDLHAMVRQFHLEKHVVFTGFSNNIPEVMQAFDIFVMPSRQEAFGLVAIEAMAMECPIVISSGGSAEEIAGPNREFGRIMRPEDAFDLQQQLRWMIDHPDERKSMGQAARDHVRAHYDCHVRLERTLELYDWSIRRRRGL